MNKLKRKKREKKSRQKSKQIYNKLKVTILLEEC